MNTMIDLGSEVLVDSSMITDPYLRLLAAAVGQRVASGSPWMAVNKRDAAQCCRPNAPLAVARRGASGSGTKIALA